MSKTIDTLVDDIADILRGVREGKSVKIDDKDLAELGAKIAVKIQRSLTARTSKRPPKTIYMSEVGYPCLRKLWYELHQDTFTFDKEPLDYNVVLKFMYGDIIEEIILFLAKQAGHTVTDEQKLVEFKAPRDWVIRGRMDAKIDGEIVDVKSASSYSFKKFKKGLVPDEDTFGYIAQLQAYNFASDVMPGKTTSFIAVDKQNGSIVRDVHKANMAALEDEEQFKKLEGLVPPDRHFDAKPTTYGNEELGIECSYCQWKYECWKDANGGKGLRVFAYANKPVFLTKVKTVPGKAKEITPEKK